VARISPEVTNCVLYLYQSVAAAQTGEGSGGSGFFVHIHGVNGRKHLYAVTNKHVIEHGFTVLRVNTKDGQFDSIPTRFPDWTFAASDDLAVLPLGLDESFAFNSVSDSWFATEDKFYDARPIGMTQGEESTAAEDDWPEYGYGDDVVLVGRLIANDGKQKNRPVVRYGSLSMLADPNELIQLETGSQEAFLVECRSLSGFSGSPVFIYPSALSPSGLRLGYVGDLLLGIDCAHVPFWKPVYETVNGQRRKTNYRVETNTGIAAVIPAWRLQKLLDEPTLMEKRKELDEQARAEDERESRAVSDVASDEDRVFTKADFEQALKKVAKKRPDSGTAQTSDE
jgi:hypothetical protein